MTRPCLRVLAVAGLLLAVGCGNPTTGALTGNVKYEGALLTNGTVLVRGEDGRIANANIQEDGTYRVPDAPVGKVQLAVQTFPPSPSVLPPGVKPETAKQPSLKYTKLPQRYHDFKTSNLSVTVTSGETKHDIELKK